MALLPLTVVTTPRRSNRTTLLVITLCITMISALAGLTQAQEWDDWIGLYADPDGQIPMIEVLPGILVQGYFVLHLPTYADQNILCANFKVENWPESGSQGIISVDWGGAGCIGSIGDGIIVCTNSQSGDWVLDENANVVIGVVYFISFDASWPGQNVRLEFVGWGLSPDFPLIVTDDFYEHYVGGDICWLNKYITAVHDGSFSMLKALY